MRGVSWFADAPGPEIRSTDLRYVVRPLGGHWVAYVHDSAGREVEIGRAVTSGRAMALAERHAEGGERW